MEDNIGRKEEGTGSKWWWGRRRRLACCGEPAAHQPVTTAHMVQDAIANQKRKRNNEPPNAHNTGALDEESEGT
jgi:hypothetical protein